MRLVGAVLMSSGVVGFEWSIRALGEEYSPSFDLRVPRRYVRTGPYRFAAHPLYLSNSAILLGAIVASGSVIVMVSAAIVLVYYLRAARIESALRRASGGPVWPRGRDGSRQRCQ
jgi:protein-S-isoprenylcysteine O-methyltransferase Ste14